LDADIPIDIQYAKLGEWLEDRSTTLTKQHPESYTNLLASAAALLRNMKYEIPALRDEIGKATSKLREAEALLVDSLRRKKDLGTQLERELSELGLKGCEEDDLFRSIEEHIPMWMSKVVECLQTNVTIPLEYYVEYCRWQSAGRSPPCENLRHVLTKGNTTVAELGRNYGWTELDQCVPLLLCDATRALVTNDCLELQAFLGTRHAQMTSTTAHNGLLTLDAPQRDTADLAQFLEKIQSVLVLLQGRATTHLLLLRASPQYRTRVVTSLRLMQQKISRSHVVGEQAEESIEALRAELQDKDPKLQLLLQETKDLKTACERQLRKIYHPREVNIIGAINAL